MSVNIKNSFQMTLEERQAHAQERFLVHVLP